MLGEGPDDITSSVCTTEKKLVLTLVNQRQDFAGVSIIMVIIVTCILMEKNSKSLKLIKKCQLSNSVLSRNHIWNNWCCWITEASFKGNRYDFSVDCNDILNIYKYLMVKNKIK